jgi:hypothetical protein
MAYLASIRFFHVVDIEAPDSLRVLSSTEYVHTMDECLRFKPSTVEIAVKGNHVYLPGQEVWDVSDPESPVLVSRFPWQPAVGREVTANRLIQAASSEGIQIWDLNQESTPLHQSSIYTPGPAYRVRADGNRLYVAAGTHGLLVYNDFCTDAMVPVRILSMSATRTPDGATIQWEIADEDLTRFHVHRDSPTSAGRERLTDLPLTAGPRFSYTDPAPPDDQASYWLEELSRDASSRWHGPVVLPPAASPDRIRFLSAVPSPFQSSVEFTLRNPVSGSVGVWIVDVQGRRVATVLEGPLAAGVRTLTWDGVDQLGRNARPGIYFARLQGRTGSSTLKLVKVGP